jgi:hypothetical protein
VHIKSKMITCHGSRTLIQNISAEAGKEKKVKSPPGIEEERSASKRRRNSSSASSHNPVQGKQKLGAFLDFLKTQSFCSRSVWLWTGLALMGPNPNPVAMKLTELSFCELLETISYLFILFFLI